MMQQEPVSTLLYRVETIEKDLVQVKSQLSLYEPVAYNDLKLQRINDTLARIETDMRKVKDELGAMNTRMTLQDKDLQVKDAAQRESQSALQIRTLIFIVSTVVTILVAVLVGYITHLLH
jgi:hypothetical protein